MTRKRSVGRRVSKRARSARKQISKVVSMPMAPVRRTRSRINRSAEPTIFGIPLWAAASLGIAAFGGMVYGLMQFDKVRIFMNPVIHDVGEFFGLTDENGIDTKNITHDRIYSSTIRS